MNHPPVGTAPVDALVMGWVLIAAIPVLTFFVLAGVRSRISAYLAVVAGFALQSFHSFEHVIQVVFWGKNPYAPGYMSPVAKKAAAGLESIAASTLGWTGRSTLGMELLHLVGNTLFLLGIAALLIGSPFAAKRAGATLAFTFEGLHLLEHVILTATTVAGYPAWGNSTLFNTISGAQLSSHRIWWHFVMNIAALALFALAIFSEKFSRRVKAAAVSLLVVANFLPIAMAHFFAAPQAGYGSTAQLLDLSTVTAWLFNPITVTIALILLAPPSSPVVPLASLGAAAVTGTVGSTATDKDGNATGTTRADAAGEGQDAAAGSDVETGLPASPEKP
jgi:hypothetical protein